LSDEQLRKIDEEAEVLALKTGDYEVL